MYVHIKKDSLTISIWLFLLFFIALFFSSCVSLKVANEDSSPNAPIKTSESASEGQYYTVKRGDSLWKISKTYEIDVNTLAQTNGISATRDLKIGQQIFIPYSYQNKSEFVFIWPIKGEIISSFGENINNIVNKGLNIKTSGEDNVKAAASGEVVFCNYLKGWGKTIILKHPQSFYTIYANLNELFVKEGLKVTGGQKIANIASGKNNTGNILHFEIRKQYLPQNPIKYLK